MADTKASALTAITTTEIGDKLYIVDDPGGTPLSRAVTLGDLIPIYTTAGMNAIGTPTAGMLIYNSDEAEPYFYNGSDWLSLVDGLPE